MKKQLLCMAAAMMAVSAFSATPAFAAEIIPGDGDITTEVTYDNKEISTEGDPDQAEWGVAVPSKVLFTDDKKTADVSVELVDYNGYSLKDLYTVDPNFEATVSVISENKMNLAIGTGANKKDETAYKMKYGAKVVDEKNTDIVAGNKTEIAKLGITKTGEVYTGKTEAGIAELTGTSTMLGAHTDKLIFSVAGGTKQP